MIRNVIKYGVSFVLLVLFQGLILNNIELGGYINPFLYVLFILALPFDTPDWVVLSLGFLIGVFIDIFTSTLGMHASATVFMGFMRVFVLRLFKPRDGYDFNTTPSLQNMGLMWYFNYASVLIVLHHLFLFYIESFKLSQFFATFGRAMLSSVFTLVLVFIIQLFSYKPANRL